LACVERLRAELALDFERLEVDFERLALDPERLALDLDRLLLDPDFPEVERALLVPERVLPLWPVRRV
jgi:hypothetical protein